MEGVRQKSGDDDMKISTSAFLVACAVLLAACGGGGGDSAAGSTASDTLAAARHKSPATPSAVASMTLSSPATNSMVVAWTAATSAGSSAITGYRVGWIEGGTGRTWQSTAPHYPLSSSPLTLTGLLPNTSYQVQVTPFNSYGAGVMTTRTLSTLADTVTPPTTGTGSAVVAGYYPNWTPSPVRIRDVNPNYNLIYLFSAVPVGGSPGTTGAVYFDLPGDGRGAATNFVADLQYARTVQHRKIILSVGGAGNGMSFPTRTKSQAFVDSIVALYNQFGGFDGLDWNTFEGSQAPDTSEMIWMSLELKRLFPGFIITAPPAPWNSVDMQFCQAMLNASALDYCAPQYYDGPGLDVPSYVASNAAQWVSLLGESHVVIGFGVSDAVNYMTIDEVKTSWNMVKAQSPGIRGAFDWQIHVDEAAGWSFANTMGPLINP
jgi:chitinase